MQDLNQLPGEVAWLAFALALVFGAIANWVGTPGTLMIGGAVCLLAVAAFATQLSSIRQASHLFDEDKKRASRENA